MTKLSRRPQKKRPKSNGPTSEINPTRLIKKAQKSESKKNHSQTKIEDLPLNKKLIEQLQKKGFVRPSEIQEKSFPHLLEGKNLLGIAQTGTGKTGAFLIPVIQQLITNGKSKSYALVVVPTRELALQVEQEFKSMTSGLKLFSACFIGGTNINKDVQILKRGQHIAIATPGRLLDLESRKAIDLKKFNTLILDEFDRMLDMGFSRDVGTIVSKMMNRKQTLLFSATLDKGQRQKINQILGKHETVQIASGQTSSDRVNQDIIVVNNNQQKFSKLLELLHQDDFKRVIVFDETKHRVKRLCLKLNKSGIQSAEIQGNKSQNARQKALKDFKSGVVKVLVATDVAGRGIDVNDVSHVINYQLPKTYDSYIHRIGRTGRAGKYGTALTFVDQDNQYLKQEKSNEQH